MSDLTADLAKALAEYTDEVAFEVKSAVDDVSRELFSAIQLDGPERTGKYKKAMRLKTVYEDRLQKKKLWYVAAPYYRLTHLLEFGHVKKNGGRVEARPHVSKNDEIAQKKLLARVERALAK